ncbi:Endopolyphosphatase [Neophaeococcomyces mojaviensis]|uniref:Endopolyphosphatase n=1 Tax=Neophaeococcomyces mojaviensis TaxID=3383035 RepID=A0ACC3ABF6_9EURO|nr:Endopolyphosphatase [Knufia sp. JES_112]
MVWLTSSLLLFSALTAAAPTDQYQHVLDTADESIARTQRKLQGKFLHITDIHPDPFYRQGSDPAGEHPCHRGEGGAGYFGAEKTECDSPFALINATFEWIKDHVRDDIDFVVWTGDSARHDNDLEYPRTNRQVEWLNEFVVDKFVEVFGKNGHHDDPNPQNDFVIPIVPTFGNNDILPHNILSPGPNRWTRKYLSIWNKFVPEEQRHSFARGGWFFTEVIPNKLAVFSLNTLYFFESNSAVDGCSDPSDPGYQHFNWLRIQLQLLRLRKMKAILTGHIPPARTANKSSWDETCYQKYTLWLRQYRDVIVGNLFGHMNIDHFMLQDVRDLTFPFPIDGIDTAEAADNATSITDNFHAFAKSDYLSDLRDSWGQLPTPPKGTSFLIDEDTTLSLRDKNDQKFKKFLKEIGGPYAERFSLSLVTPSVVPNFYPTLRIIEYNITGLKHDHPALVPTAPVDAELYPEDLQLTSPSSWPCTGDFEDDLGLDNDHIAGEAIQEKRKKGKKPKPNFAVPKAPSKSAPPGPAYSPQTFSFLSWTQLYANLTEINKAIAQEAGFQETPSEIGMNVGMHEELLQKHLKYEVEYKTDEEPYRMRDLTVRSWVDLAEKIGRAKFELPEDSVGSVTDSDLDLITDVLKKKHKKKHGKKRKGQTLKENKLWHTFVKRAFVGTKPDSELEDEFG